MRVRFWPKAKMKVAAPPLLDPISGNQRVEQGWQRTLTFGLAPLKQFEPGPYYCWARGLPHGRRLARARTKLVVRAQASSRNVNIP